MMKKNLPRPKWFILYLLTFLYLGAFWMELQGGFSEAGHIWAEAGLTFVYFWLVLAWLKANELALWVEDQGKRELSRQSRVSLLPGLPEQAQRPVLSGNGNSRPEQSLVRRFSRGIPAWLIAVVSHLGDLFHRMH